MVGNERATQISLEGAAAGPDHGQPSAGYLKGWLTTATAVNTASPTRRYSSSLASRKPLAVADSKE